MCETCGCGHSDHQHLHIIIPVSGMQNAGCAAKIETALNNLTGVHATADYELGAVSLLLHEDDDLAAAKKTITDMGYRCKR